MATLEVGFRSAGEYAHDRQPKLNEEQLCVDELYVGMFELAGEGGDHQAAKQVCRVTDIDMWGRVYGVALEILDGDFQVSSHGWVVFEDGSNRLVRGLSIEGEPVNTCYLKKPYFGWPDKVMERCLAGYSGTEEEPLI